MTTLSETCRLQSRHAGLSCDFSIGISRFAAQDDRAKLHEDLHETCLQVEIQITGSSAKKEASFKEFIHVDEIFDLNQNSEYFLQVTHLANSKETENSDSSATW